MGFFGSILLVVLFGSILFPPCVDAQRTIKPLNKLVDASALCTKLIQVEKKLTN